MAFGEESKRGGKRDWGIITNRVSRTEEKSEGERKMEGKIKRNTNRKYERMKEVMQERENVLKKREKERKGYCVIKIKRERDRRERKRESLTPKPQLEIIPIYGVGANMLKQFDFSCLLCKLPEVNI